MGIEFISSLIYKNKLKCSQKNKETKKVGKERIVDSG